MKAINLAACLIPILLFGCADQQKQNIPGQDLASYPSDPNARKEIMKSAFEEIAGTEWVLVGYQGSPLPEELRERTTLKFSGRSDEGEFQISGRAFINNYLGKFRIDETTGLITPIGGVASTKIGGLPRDMDAEVMYFHNLDRATFFRIDDEDQLILYFDEDRFAYFTEK